MDGVILVALMVPAVIAVFSIMIHVISNDGGTKGITQPYTTKSGTKRTAHKSREQHIV